MAEDAGLRDADFEAHFRRTDNIFFREQISVRPNVPPSAGSFGTPDTPS